MKILAKRKLLEFLNDLQAHKKIQYIDSTNGATRLDSIRRMMSGLLTGYLERQKTQIFDCIVGYDGIKRTFLRSLNSEEPVHILLVGPPGQAKTLFLKCIQDTFVHKKAFFTIGGNASKSGLIDVLFDMRPYYLLIDEIEHLKPEYQTTLLSLMETGVLTQTMHLKVRHMHLKTWVFATSNGTKKLS
jgi:Holliday junction DNA helicase RuvB